MAIYNYFVSIDRHWLLAILRGAKFSQDRAQALVERQLSMITDNPQWFRDIDTEDNKIQAVIDSG